MAELAAPSPAEKSAQRSAQPYCMALQDRPGPRPGGLARALLRQSPTFLATRPTEVRAWRAARPRQVAPSVPVGLRSVPAGKRARVRIEAD